MTACSCPGRYFHHEACPYYVRPALDAARPAHDGHGPLRCHDGCPAYASFMAEMHDQMRPAAPDAPRPAANVTDVLEKALTDEYGEEGWRELGSLRRIAAALAEAGIGPVAEAVNAEWDKIVDVLADHANQVHEAERRGAKAVLAAVENAYEGENRDVSAKACLTAARAAAEQAGGPSDG